jgi:large subunit ribosomal protein L15
MKAPMQLDFAKSFKNKVWNVNNDPARLDDMYNRLLGPGGSKMLPEELKWLAVTHKSFDQGRRGFNDKLALMGTFPCRAGMPGNRVLMDARPIDARYGGDQGSCQQVPVERITADRRVRSGAL